MWRISVCLAMSLIVMQGKDKGGGYEEVVFRDAKFAAGDTGTRPPELFMHAATHHTNVEGGIGHGQDDLVR